MMGNWTAPYVRRLVSLLSYIFVFLFLVSTGRCARFREQGLGYGSNLQYTHQHDTPVTAPVSVSLFESLRVALAVLQSDYFSLWLGKYTEAIDWTAAVTGTHVSAVLNSMSRSQSYTMLDSSPDSRTLDFEARLVENEVNRYFGNSVAYYFGEDYFSIRMQAHDDMLWVVLGWLESIQFIKMHSALHYSFDNGNTALEWHGDQFTNPFAHRARVFYELAEEGWDWRLCGGGLTWDPRLLPYKNAITNQLFISASIAMYLHFPGDSNDSPFAGAKVDHTYHEHSMSHARDHVATATCSNSTPTYDPAYLANAINGYDWLANINMTNDQGLYVDGFHIRDYAHNHSKTHCDERNEMVYTYNQGVILSGLRGLWEATGNVTYLQDGHDLVLNVIRATGWASAPETPFTINALHPRDLRFRNPLHVSKQVTLGSDGILTELCDPSGTCNQDAQTFKGVFFHHLNAFCTTLPRIAVKPGKTHAASYTLWKLHHRSCDGYLSWIRRNAEAAMRTRDERGRFGAWWGACEGDTSNVMGRQKGDRDQVQGDQLVHGGSAQARLTKTACTSNEYGDLNDRGRGRTVETQGGGVAVVRTLWEFSKRAEEHNS